MIFTLGFISGIVSLMILRVVLYRLNKIAYRNQMKKAEEKLNELVEKVRNGEFN